MNTINFTADLEPVPFKRVRANGKYYFNCKRYSLFKEVLGHLAKIAMKGQEPLKGSIKISVNFFRNLKPQSLNYGDLDNHLKSVLDALNGICFLDDRQVISATVNLFQDFPHIDILIEEVKE